MSVKKICMRAYAALCWRARKYLVRPFRLFARTIKRTHRRLYWARKRAYMSLRWQAKKYLVRPFRLFARTIKRTHRRLYWARKRIYMSLRWHAKKYLGKWLKKSLHKLENFHGKSYRQVIKAYETQGKVVAVERVKCAEPLKPQAQAKALQLLARRELSVNVLSAAELARKSLSIDNSELIRRRNCMTLWDSGCIQEASSLLNGIPPAALTMPEQEKALQIQGAQRLFECLPEIPASPAKPPYLPIAQRVLYVASSSRPYHTTGYTTRTHHLLESLREQGWDVHCVTRPGYPADRPDARNLDSPALNLIDGVPYQRLAGKHRREVLYDQYLFDAADALVEAAMQLRPAVIHAASNYEAGLPALLAARRLGLPFCYEVRGLWEYTAASKKQGWEHTERFALDRALEAYTASHADKVFTLTKALAGELVNRGVPAERIELLPNAVNLDFFKPLATDRSLAQKLGVGVDTFVCGYAGSVVKYEGLDDLLHAWPSVVAQVPNSRLLIVGDGDELANLRDLAHQLGISKQVTFTGRVPHTEVTRYFSLFSTIALPRKPFTVCKLVSPLKPFEAMAMCVPQVVSDVDALGEIFVHGESALLHKAGDFNSLSEALIALAKSHELRKKLTENAYEQVCKNSQWGQVIRPLCSFYELREASYLK